ncbi:class I SAM-dependent methyltransferase [Clostridiaceae bacterium M8S5]|nr:class I SAM-dependent methyltransferase [Clostridiaceae bacterium M8S5]
MINECAVSQEYVYSNFSRLFDLKGKRVLEIGGALPIDLIKESKVKEWISIDPRNENVQESIVCRRINGRGSSICYKDSYFDFVFSSNAFEHISDLRETFDEIARVLATDGVLYTHFGPIWTAPDGHHIDITVDDEKFYFWENSVIPHWSHLAYKREEFQKFMNRKFDENISAKITEAIYDSDWLNRLHFEEYVDIINNSQLRLLELSTCDLVDYEYEFPNYGITEHQLLKKTISHHKTNIDVYTRDILLIMKKD